MSVWGKVDNGAMRKKCRLVLYVLFVVLCILLFKIPGILSLLVIAIVTRLNIRGRLLKKIPVKSIFASWSGLFLALTVSLWACSMDEMMYMLFSTSEENKIGVFVFPGVVEMGYYTYDMERIRSISPDKINVNGSGYLKLDDSDMIFNTLTLSLGPMGLGPYYVRVMPLSDKFVVLGILYEAYSPLTPSTLYFNNGRWRSDMNYASTHLGFPLYLLVLASFAFYGRYLVTLHKFQHRILNNLCLICGYDLTANVSGVCPECGTPVDPELLKKLNAKEPTHG